MLEKSSSFVVTVLRTNPPACHRAFAAGTWGRVTRFVRAHLTRFCHRLRFKTTFTQARGTANPLWRAALFSSVIRTMVRGRRGPHGGGVAKLFPVKTGENRVVKNAARTSAEVFVLDMCAVIIDGRISRAPRRVVYAYKTYNNVWFTLCIV